MSQGHLLDTNVLSELMREQPASEVMDWFACHANSPMYTSSVTQAEVLTGIALLPQGKRRDGLVNAAQRTFEQEMAGCCLAFDQHAARHYAAVRTARQQQGLPVTTEDAQIAAIALANDLVVATRNTKDFARIPNLVVENPWNPAENNA